MCYAILSGAVSAENYKLTAAQSAYWDDTFRRLATSEEWNKELGDFNALIDELGGAPVHYCGESLGGILGVACHE